MRGYPCLTTLHHTVGIGICMLNYLCHCATLYLTYHGAQHVATGLVYNLAFLFQNLPSLEIIHRSNGDNDTMQALPSGLSRVLTQHGSGLILHSTSPLNPSRSCMHCRCCSWDLTLNVNEFTSLTFPSSATCHGQ